MNDQPKNAIRPDLPEPPPQIRALEVDARGYPIPFFVDYVDGAPDFRVMDTRKLKLAVDKGLCWICGTTLGKFKVFNVGPMCAVSRISAEPPSHRACAIYAAHACPFLTKPQVERRHANMPKGYRPAPGVMLTRNPGVTMLWITRSFRVVPSQHGHSGALFELGAPLDVMCFKEGRRARWHEIVASIESGLPLLREQCDREGMPELEKAIRDAYNTLQFFCSGESKTAGVG